MRQLADEMEHAQEAKFHRCGALHGRSRVSNPSNENTARPMKVVLLVSVAGADTATTVKICYVP
jgi:hypothetical protein